MSDKDFYLYIDGRRVRVSEEVYLEYKRHEDKERYFMKSLKQGRTIVDHETQMVTYIPGREVSYEGLLEEHWEFPAPDEAVDDAVVKAQMGRWLEEALHSLTDEEMSLIQELFYLEKTEREAAGLFQVSQNTIHYRKCRALEKLKKLLEKNLKNL